jgi:hypothetical protein
MAIVLRIGRIAIRHCIHHIISGTPKAASPTSRIYAMSRKGEKLFRIVIKMAPCHCGREQSVAGSNPQPPVSVCLELEPKNQNPWIAGPETTH